MLASGADSAAALAKSRTMDALVLNRSGYELSEGSSILSPFRTYSYHHESCLACEARRQG